ncbi:VOC family protein [Actinomycetes bacterium KLBMP 9759]
MPWLHAVLDVPAAEWSSAARFWSDALGWPAGGPWRGHPELRSFEPPQGRAYVHLQQIDGPPRVHLDVESDDIEATVADARDLGAESVDVQDRWQTLRSPGGLAFCVVHSGAHDPPEPVTWPDGHRSRMVQVCVDSPVAAHEAEVAFWRALLPGRWAGSGGREFAGKWHDDVGSPVQLLFQRLDEADGPVRAHLDLGTDELTAEVRRLLSLGATDIGPGHGGWWALRDPAGLLFCATANPPEQTELRDIG